jgi:hypothetical protein
MPGFAFKVFHYLEIERAERYVKQLNSHLSKKAALYEGFLLFPGLGAAEAMVIPDSNMIRLMAVSDSEESLEKIKFILAKHLYKFAKLEFEPETLEWT